MTEWLLSGHNPHESYAESRPLTITTSVVMQADQFHWFLVQMCGGDESDFDPTLYSLVAVQNWVYINMTYYARNAGVVFPFDPASMGVPAEYLKVDVPKAPLGRQLMMLPRFLGIYRWLSAFHKTLPPIDQRLRSAYWELRNSKDPLPLIWSLFADDLYEHVTLSGRAHVLSALFIIALDGAIRGQVPELVDLFMGHATTTSMIGRRLWELRGIAEKCGPEVVTALTSRRLDLNYYTSMPAAAPLVAGVEQFLKDYGHRGFEFEMDYAAGRLADHPEHVLMAVASQLQRTSETPEVRAGQAREKATAALKKMNPLKRLLWGRILGWGQKLISWREDSKSNLALQRALHGRASRILTRHFYPDLPEDSMMFYTWEEYVEFGKSQGQKKVSAEVLNQRRAEFDLYLSQTPPAELIWYNPETRHWRLAEVAQDKKAQADDQAIKVLNGFGVSAGPGVVEGVAIVTNDPVDAGERLMSLKGPAILVTRLTDPAWSSLFAGLTAVVTELGGVISHASIVARENGLPAVVGVPEATKWIRNGQRLRINGATGVVEIIE